MTDSEHWVPFTDVAATLMAGAARDYNAAKAFKGEHLAWRPVSFEPGIASRTGGHIYDDISGTLRSNPGDNAMSVIALNPEDFSKFDARRFTPKECERLMGFPDDYTKIPFAGKPLEDCPDAPRYKALGNSWAVNVVRWIGKRLAEALSL